MKITIRDIAEMIALAAFSAALLFIGLTYILQHYGSQVATNYVVGLTMFTFFANVGLSAIRDRRLAKRRLLAHRIQQMLNVR